MKKIISFFILALCYTMIGFCQSDDTIGNAKIAEEIKVFPNPATNIINVLGLQNSANALIVVSDVYGNTVLQHN